MYTICVHLMSIYCTTYTSGNKVDLSGELSQASHPLLAFAVKKILALLFMHCVSSDICLRRENHFQFWLFGVSPKHPLDLSQKVSLVFRLCFYCKQTKTMNSFATNHNSQLVSPFSPPRPLSNTHVGRGHFPIMGVKGEPSQNHLLWVIWKGWAGQNSMMTDYLIC